MLRIQSRPRCRMHFIHLVWWLLVHCDSESVDGGGGGRREKEGEEEKRVKKNIIHNGT